MRISKFDICLKLINEAMNETIERWSNEPERLRDYAWGHRDGDGESRIVVGNNHGTTFFNAGTVIDIARVCGCGYYLCMCPNEDEELTPCISVYAY